MDQRLNRPKDRVIADHGALEAQNQMGGSEGNGERSVDILQCTSL